MGTRSGHTHSTASSASHAHASCLPTQAPSIGVGGLTDMTSLIPSHLCFSAFSFQCTRTVETHSRTPNFAASLPHYIDHKLSQKTEGNTLKTRRSDSQWCYCIYFCTYAFVILKLVVIILTMCCQVL